MLNLFSKIESFIYPPLCLHCGEHTQEGGILFCPACTTSFFLLEPTGQNFEGCFVYDASVATFVKELKSGRMPFLSKIAASFLFLQLQKLPWSCDLIIPVPSSTFLHDAVHNMGYHLAHLSNTLFTQPIKKKRGRAKQALLSKEERATLAPWDFILSKPEKITERSILIIDDVMTTGSTFRALTSLLYDQGARQVHGLALAETFLD